MQREIDLIMFDLDGTLADTGQDLANAVNRLRAHLGLEPLERRQVYAHVGRGVEHLIRSCLPESLRASFDEARAFFLQYYEEHLLDTTVLYPRVKETLEHFRGKRKAVVSNKLHKLSVAILKGLGIGDSFDAILGGDSSPKKKPDPAPLNRLLSDFRVSPKRSVMVGDAGIDIEAGKRAGVYTCGVTYGLCEAADVAEAKPDFMVDDLGQLKNYFC